MRIVLVSFEESNPEAVRAMSIRDPKLGVFSTARF